MLRKDLRFWIEISSVINFGCEILSDKPNMPRFPFVLYPTAWRVVVIFYATFYQAFFVRIGNYKSIKVRVVLQPCPNELVFTYPM